MPTTDRSEFLDAGSELGGFLPDGGLLGGGQLRGLPHGHPDAWVIQETVLMPQPEIPIESVERTSERAEVHLTVIFICTCALF